MSESANRTILTRREALLLSATAGVGLAAARPAFASDSVKTAAHQEPGNLSTPRSAIAKTQYGKVRGFVDGRVFTFKGVPYGQSTAEGNRIEAATVMWAAGVTASPAAAWISAAADRAGRIRVERDLSVSGHPEIFAIGDTALALGPNGAQAPGLAPAAKQMGRYVGRLIAARVQSLSTSSYRDAPLEQPQFSHREIARESLRR